MAAATAISLQLRPKHRAIRNPAFLHFLSTSTNSDPNDQPQSSTATSPESPPEPPQSSFASYFSDVKASLKQQPPPPNRQQPRRPFSLSFPASEPAPSRVASVEEIRKNLSEFRRRSVAPPTSHDKSSSPSPSHVSQPISFEELYKRNVINKGQESSNEASKGGKLSFEAIRESLRQLRQNNQGPGSKINEQKGFKLRPGDLSSREPIIVTDKLPSSVFEKEMRKKEEESAEMKTEFVKTYSCQELGEKLRKLRPEGRKGENWFSLQELNERLMKLRELEQRENESRIGGVTFQDLRDSLLRLKMSDDEKAKKLSLQRLDVLGHLGGTPSYMLEPAKEHLVEMYFHPDNMSSAEKLKLELKKVREEFKMSESDCGSARVQVAQLTTKIKHLSTVLHKKDKHSRKGLQEMVQNRKKLLKYLRRTDWDSYCLVLSKLGLRDNPDYKK